MAGGRGHMGRLVRTVGAGALAAVTGAGVLALAAAPASAGAARPVLIWQQVLPGAEVVASSPNLARLAGGPSVVVGAEDGRLYAFHLSDGSRVPGWPASTPEPIASSPAAAPLPGGGGDEVITGSGTAATVGEGGVYAFGPGGQPLWSRQLPSAAYPGKPSDAVTASTAIGVLGAGGAVRATAGVVGQAVYSLDAATGATAAGWPYKDTDSVYSSPALTVVPGGGGVAAVEGTDSSPGVLPGQFQGGGVRALSASGKLLWEWRTDDVVTSSPAVGRLGGSSAPPEIVVGGGDYWYRTTGHHTAASTSLTALSLSGSVEWRKDLGGVTADSPALADLLGNGQLDVVEGTLKGANDQVGGPGSGMVWALGPSGNVLPGWPVDPVPGAFVTGQVSTADLLGNGRQDVLVPTPQGLFAYDGQGHLLWRVESGLGGDSVGGHPVVLQNAPLVTTDAGGRLGITIAGFVDTTGNGIIQHYEVSGATVGHGAWPMWRHDPQLTGNASSPGGPGAGPAPAPPAGHIPLTRLSGANRDGTAVAVSRSDFPAGGSAGAVVLASDSSYPDALAGTPLAARRRAPLLLVPPSGLTPAVTAEIGRVLPAGGTVYILGGTARIPAATDSVLRGRGYTVQRLAGPDRFATAVAVADALGGPSTVLEATGTDFPDALSAGAAAATVGGAVLLTNGRSQSPATAAYLSAHPGSHYAVGGPAAAADPPATAVVGATRYDTSVDVARRFFTPAVVAGFASGTSFPDALSGGAHVGRLGGPVVLVPGSGLLPPSVVSWLSSAGSSITGGYVYGGTSAVGSDVYEEIG
ncbi:MAG: cell wall-binding repeat-containing protein [Acidimicrobiales bacterium]